MTPSAFCRTGILGLNCFSSNTLLPKTLPASPRPTVLLRRPNLSPDPAQVGRLKLGSIPARKSPSRKAGSPSAWRDEVLIPIQFVMEVGQGWRHPTLGELQSHSSQAGKSSECQKQMGHLWGLPENYLFLAFIFEKQSVETLDTGKRCRYTNEEIGKRCLLGHTLWHSGFYS